MSIILPKIPLFSTPRREILDATSRSTPDILREPQMEARP